MDTVLQTIRETFEEVSTKRNAALLTVERRRKDHRSAATTLRNAQAQYDLAHMVEEATRRKQRELTDHCNALLDKPRALLEKIETLSSTLMDHSMRTRRADEIVQQCQQAVDQAQAAVEVAEQDAQRLDAEVAELQAHLSRLN